MNDLSAILILIYRKVSMGVVFILGGIIFIITPASSTIDFWLAGIIRRMWDAYYDEAHRYYKSKFK